MVTKGVWLGCSCVDHGCDGDHSDGHSSLTSFSSTRFTSCCTRDT
ncbi:putative lipoprotein [Synechococcus sp. A18-25c]|nr:putative lipoprotein [Synechococcus sp. A18-25c]